STRTARCLESLQRGHSSHADSAPVLINWISTFRISTPTPMKSARTFALATLASLATAVGTLATYAAQELREEFHQTYPLTKQGKVSLDNVNGDVRVVTWDRDEIQVDAVKHAKQQEEMDRLTIEVNAKADSIGIKSRYSSLKPRSGRNNSASVDYVL